MKVFFSIWFILLFANPGLEKWNLASNSNVAIQGDSNVTDFTCNLNKIQNHPAVWISRKNNVMEFSNSIILLPGEKFQCDNALITSDFRDMIKIKEYPQIKIKMVRIDHLKHKTPTGIMDISIAGTTKRKEWGLKVSEKTGHIHISGSNKLNLKEFNLKAPNKMFGLVKIEDVITIDFNFYLSR